MVSATGTERGGRPVSDIDGLTELGYSPRWQALFASEAGDGMMPARVVRVSRGSALVATPAGIVRAKASARLLKAAAGPADLPVVGDWVAVADLGEVDVAQMDLVLDRASAITRGDPGRGSEKQVLAA